LNEPNCIPVKPSLFTEDFVITHPGEPYRLLPFGKIGRPGLDKNITPEFARLFKLPHFKPPIKLGSHEETTPAGGHIIGLEVRDDGLYAIPEMNEAGSTSLINGDFRYHSPEIIWEDEGIFDTQGNYIAGPLILGDAMLHTPHLGEAASLYGIQIYKIDQTKEVKLSEPTKDIGLFEKLLGGKENEVTRLEAEKADISEQVTKLSAEKADLQNRLEKLTAEHDEIVSKFEAIQAKEEQSQKEGIVRDALGDIELEDDIITMLSEMPDEHREKLITKFKALHEQAKIGGDVEEELGSTAGGIDDPAMALSIAIKHKADEEKINYLEAQAKLLKEKPELFEAYNKSIEGGK